jgi:hypothetical protein
MNKCPSGVPGCEGPLPPGTPFRDRKALLRNLAVGDIFHASAPNGASLICLTTAVMAADEVIQARTVTHQIHLEFDRETGIAEWNAAKEWPNKGHDDVWVQCTIDSVAPLPIDVHNLMLFKDRKARLTYLSGNARLSDDEKDAFLFMYSYYRDNPLPGADMHDRAVEASPVEQVMVALLAPAQATAPPRSRLS